MSRYIRMVLLVVAGVFFMIPILGRPAAAKPMPRLHGSHFAGHQQHQTFADPGLGDDDFAVPCAEQ